jgi:hypothetical protein
MEQKSNVMAIPVEDSSLEEGDVLPEEVRVFPISDQLNDMDYLLCDGEGGMAPSKGTKAA